MNVWVFHLVGECRNQWYDCKISNLSNRKVGSCPNRAGQCVILWLINNINSSAVMTHKSTIINNVLSQCHHSLTSSRFSCQDAILFSCPCHWISHFSWPILNNLQQNTMLYSNAIGLQEIMLIICENTVRVVNLLFSRT